MATGTVDHTMVLWQEDGSLYLFCYTGRFHPDDLEKIPKPSSPLPANTFEAPRDPSLSYISEPFPPDSYLKSPPLFIEKDVYERIVAGETYSPGMNMLGEANIYEKLRLKPHLNICHFYGCILSPQGDTVKGLCLRKYRCTLQQAMDCADHPLKVESVMQDIREGLTHLHKMGFAHNDLNLSNVMLDDEDRAILIDFDSCLPIGEGFNGRKAGTFGWQMDPPPVTSERHNDWFAFAILQKHLQASYANSSSSS